MNNEPEPGMGFLPTASSPKKRIAPDVVPNPTPAPVVNNFYVNINEKAAEALRDAMFMLVILVLAFAAFRYGPKLLRA